MFLLDLLSISALLPDLLGISAFLLDLLGISAFLPDLLGISVFLLSLLLGLPPSAWGQMLLISASRPLKKMFVQDRES